MPDLRRPATGPVPDAVALPGSRHPV